MNCLVNLLAFCVFDPSNVYLTAEMQSQVRRGVNEGRWCNGHWCKGPMGVVRFGVNAPLTRSITLDYGLTHTSFINTNRDQGEESAYLSLTWRPFR